jgi:hypothetical protein
MEPGGIHRDPAGALQISQAHITRSSRRSGGRGWVCGSRHLTDHHRDIADGSPEAATRTSTKPIRNFTPNGVEPVTMLLQQRAKYILRLHNGLPSVARFSPLRCRLRRISAPDSGQIPHRIRGG